MFDCKLDTSGGNPILKKKSLAKLIEIKEALYLFDIWRIRNPNLRRFTFGRTTFPAVLLNEDLIFI